MTSRTELATQTRESEQEGTIVAIITDSDQSLQSAINDSLGVRQQPLLCVYAGRSCLIVSRCYIFDDGEGNQKMTYAVGLAGDSPSSRSSLLGVVSEGAELTIGRDHQSQLASDPRISRNHFKVSYDNGILVVTDLQSTNGTECERPPIYNDLRWATDSEELKVAILNAAKDSEIDSPTAEVSAEAGSKGRPFEYIEPTEVDSLLERAITSFKLCGTIIDRYPDICPNRGIVLDGRRFLFGDIFSVDERRMLAIAFVEGSDKNMYPRFFYKSLSDGGWRSCPGISGHHYSKGHIIYEGGYVWGTKPAHEIVSYLEERENDTRYIDYSGKVNEIDRIFNIDDLIDQGIYTYRSEVSSTKINSSISRETIYESMEPGIGLIGHPSEARKRLEEMKLPNGFMPDFSSPADGYMYQHSILGPTKVYVFEAKLNNQAIEWHVATADNHLWIERIVLASSRITSYGTHDNVILGGALACKPLEYRSLIAGMVEGVDYDRHSSGYVDMKRTIDRMPWAKEFLRCQRILLDIGKVSRGLA